MNKNRKLTISNHAATVGVFFKKNKTPMSTQKIKFKKIANCPKITKLPATKDKGKTPFSVEGFLSVKSIKRSTINTRKPRLQIKVIFEKNFIRYLIGYKRVSINWRLNISLLNHL